MKLIRIEAVGFKSFAKKVAINFDGEIVGIVGPNGSGKSNINDAILWVLGEQSSKKLRGETMEDVIFSGSKTMKPMKYAEVSLTFDNSEKTINLPHKKVVITRRIERGGKNNTYLINGEPARLKDLKDIAMESGIGKSSLAIISQGTISQIAESSPESRRYIFEEAAGISKYKIRKKNSINKLTKTTEIVEKVRTVTTELYKQVEPLKKQADKADVYLNKHKKLKEIEVALLAYDITSFSRKFKKISKDLENVTAKKEILESRISTYDVQIKAKSEYKYDLDSQIQKYTTKLTTVSEDLIQLQLRRSKIDERRKLLIEGNLSQDNKQQLDAIEEEIANLTTKTKVYDQWLEDITNNIVEKQKQKIKINLNISNQKQDKNLLQEKMYKLKSQMEILKDYELNKTNLYKGPKTIVNNRSTFDGYIGMVSDLIQVEKKYELAIDSILKNALQHIVVDNSTTAIEAIKFLKSNKGGTATFIPLQTIQPKIINEQYHMAAQTVNGFIGIASDLISVNEKYDVLGKFLLGQVMVVNDIDNAKHVAKIVENKYLIVTLEGDLIRPGGVFSGGFKVQTKSSLNLKPQIIELGDLIPRIAEKIKEKNISIQKNEELLNEVSTWIADLQIKKMSVKEKILLVNTKIDKYQTKFSAQTSEKAKLLAINSAIVKISDLEVEKSNIETNLSVKRAKLIAINDELKYLHQNRLKDDNELRRLMNSYSLSISDKNKLEFYLNNAKRRLSETYNMTYESALTSNNLTIEAGESRKIIKNLKSEIKNLGPVNVEAIEDYEKINIRYTRLKKNQDELVKAQQVIMHAIERMDRIMISRFDEATQGIRKRLKVIFKKMFGGGEIDIKYSDPNDLLTTGIEIIAQPPGKSVRTLKLFSGGEKSLMAISLLFAILEYKPLPLCILDEVEAALDEVNINKFTNYLKKLKKLTQFVVITHRVGTMEKLDVLFGTTMQSHGVTSIFSIKMKQVEKLINIEKTN